MHVETVIRRLNNVIKDIDRFIAYSEDIENTPDYVHRERLAYIYDYAEERDTALDICKQTLESIPDDLCELDRIDILNSIKQISQSKGEDYEIQFTFFLQNTNRRFVRNNNFYMYSRFYDSLIDCGLFHIEGCLNQISFDILDLEKELDFRALIDYVRNEHTSPSEKDYDGTLDSLIEVYPLPIPYEKYLRLIRCLYDIAIYKPISVLIDVYNTFSIKTFSKGISDETIEEIKKDQKKKKRHDLLPKYHKHEEIFITHLYNSFSTEYEKQYIDFEKTQKTDFKNALLSADVYNEAARIKWTCETEELWYIHSKLKPYFRKRHLILESFGYISISDGGTNPVRLNSSIPDKELPEIDTIFHELEQKLQTTILESEKK